jgi:hypothetical protein
MEQGLAPVEEPAKTAASEKKIVKAKVFVASFRERPDDFFLMEQFGLTPKHLQKVYKALLDKGLLAEYEYHARENKSPAVEAVSEPTLSLSTAVSLLEDPTTTQKVWNLEEVLTSSADRSETDEVAPRVSTPESAKVAAPAPIGSKREPKKKADSENRYLPTVCPNCRHRVHRSSPDTCLVCGVIFSKIKKHPRFEGVSIWSSEVRDPEEE